MTALAMDVRELTLAEIDMVSGGGWFADLASAIAHYAGEAMQVLADTTEWFLAHFTFTYSENGGVTVQSK